MNQPRIELLNPNQLFPNPRQPRKDFDKEGILDLARNIEKHGLIEPVIVTPKDGKFMIVAGERRWKAHKEIGRKVLCLVKEYGSQEEVDRDSLVENELRTNLSDEERFNYVTALAKGLGGEYWNAEKDWPVLARVAEYITGIEHEQCKCAGNSGAKSHNLIRHSSFYDKLQNIFGVRLKEKEGTASPKLVKAMESGELSRDTAQKISQVEDVQVQEKLVELAKTKTPRELKKVVEVHNIKDNAKELKRKSDVVKQEAEKKKNRNAERIFLKHSNNSMDLRLRILDYIEMYGSTTFAEILPHYPPKQKSEMIGSIKSLITVLAKAIESLESVLADVKNNKKPSGKIEYGDIRPEKRK